MSSRSTRRLGHGLYALVLCLLTGSVGCWEQWSLSWFPQMKKQIAVQAFEDVEYQGQSQGFVPPAGTVPIDGGDFDNDPNDDAAADALVNPRPMSLASLEGGKKQYEIYCAPCHGAGGLGDGSVSMTGNLQGPFAAILPVAGPASLARLRSDGHIYTTIRHGRRRMPSYARIQPDDRWDIVNYLRYLNGQKGVQP